MVCLDSLIIILEDVTILLAKMLIWATFSQSVRSFYFCINPDMFHHFLKTAPYMRILKSLDLNRD